MTSPSIHQPDPDPTGLHQVEKAILSALESIAPEQVGRSGRLFRVRRTRDRLTIRMDSRRLGKQVFAIEWSDGVLRFRRGRVRAFVPITRFRGRATLQEQLLFIELTRRGARRRSRRPGEEAEGVDPLGPARIRGLEARERLLERRGGTLTADSVSRRLRISRQAVEKHRRAGKLIGLYSGRRGYVYPVWQFAERGVLAGLEAVLETLREHDPWMQMAFLLNGNDWLGGRIPLEELHRGRENEVLEAARAYGEQHAP